MSGVTGGKGFAEMRAAIKALASGEFTSKIKPRLLETGLTLVHDGFNRQSDPYGKAWPRSNGFGPETNLVTGQLQSSFEGTVVWNGFSISSDLLQVGQRQYGGVIEPVNGEFLKFQVPDNGEYRVSISASNRARFSFNPTPNGARWIAVRSVKQPPRPMVPEESAGQRSEYHFSGIGPIWGAAFTAVSVETMQEILLRR